MPAFDAWLHADASSRRQPYADADLKIADVAADSAASHVYLLDTSLLPGLFACQPAPIAAGIRWRDDQLGVDLSSATPMVFSFIRSHISLLKLGARRNDY